jgi:hypothetical protein
MDEIEGLRTEIEGLNALLREKHAALYRAEQKQIAIENESIALALKGITHTLICPLCGVTLAGPPRVGLTHASCYATGYWSKGFRSHNDWIRACIENGASVQRFLEKDVEKRKESKLSIGEWQGAMLVKGVESRKE